MDTKLELNEQPLGYERFGDVLQVLYFGEEIFVNVKKTCSYSQRQLMLAHMNHTATIPETSAKAKTIMQRITMYTLPDIVWT
jgi:hypothetical protein